MSWLREYHEATRKSDTMSFSEGSSFSIRISAHRAALKWVLYETISFHKRDGTK